MIVSRALATFVAFVLVAYFPTVTNAQSTVAFPTVRSVLVRGAAAWNHADLDAFMRGYENSPNTVYVSSKRIVRGYAAIRAHYAGAYGKSGMGVLTISDLHVRPLGEDYAVAIARWHLAMTDGSHPTGLFSLVMHRAAGGWHIVVDHSP